MDEINELLKPVSPAQKFLSEIWSHLNTDEQLIIRQRMHDMFKNGLPFEIKHEKLVYVHLFSLMVQFDIMACRIPLKFSTSMSTPALQQRLRAQLLDEVFHVLLGTKIIHLLCAPYALPPEPNQNMEQFTAFFDAQTCPKIALTLVNLVSEGMAEELVNWFQKYDVAPEVFDIILEDERRHVSDAILYHEIGIPKPEALTPKVAELETMYLTIFSTQYNIGMAFNRLLGMQGIYNFMVEVDKKHRSQLKKLKLKPSSYWSDSLSTFQKLLKITTPQFTPPSEVTLQPNRKMLLAAWKDPTDPAMVGQFNIDVTSLDFFNKRFPSETLTLLMLQTMSQTLADHPEFQLFLRDSKIYQANKPRIGLVVKLPQCNEHLGVIVFESCHLMSVKELGMRMKHAISLMVFCYQKRQEIEKKYPNLQAIQENLYKELGDPIYRPIYPFNHMVGLSNIGASGYTQAVSPLLPNESCKVTMLQVDKHPVWNKTSNTFEPRDLLPVSVTVDHRVFDGQMPLPKIMNTLFQTQFQNMLSSTLSDSSNSTTNNNFPQLIEAILHQNVALGYGLLIMLQTVWNDYLSFDEVMSNGASSLQRRLFGLKNKLTANNARAEML